MERLEAYLKTIDHEEHRTCIREVLYWVKTKFPALEPRIAWNQPMFTDHGTFIIGFSAAKQHFSVSPEAKGIQKFSEEIVKSGYRLTPNLFQIRWDDPIDFSLLGRIIQYNIEDKADFYTFWRK